MRRITSLTLLLTGFIELVTSVVLYIIPAGRVAYWSDYRLMGLSKTQWGDIHITVGTLILILSGLHIYYNWKPIVSYLRNKARQLKVFNKSFNAALVISIYVTVGTLFNLPPMNYVLQVGESLSNRGNELYCEPPYGHAELSSLGMFCNKMNIDLEAAMAMLREAGIEFSGSQDTMAEIAEANRKTPQQIYDIFKALAMEYDGNAAFPESPRPGFGRETVKTVCAMYNLSLDEVLAALTAAGFAVDPDDTIQKVGADNDSNPMEIFEILRQVAGRNE